MKVQDRRDGSEHVLHFDDELIKKLDEIDERYACVHAQTELRRFPIKNGAFQLRHQCLVCGAKASNPVSKAQAPAGTPLADELLAGDWVRRRDEEKADARQAHLELQINRDTAFWNDYSQYIESPKWKSIRARIMKRAGGVCEGCLDNKATQVHHLTYKNIQKEFMFELVAVCDDCHDRYHGQGEYAVGQEPCDEDDDASSEETNDYDEPF